MCCAAALTLAAGGLAAIHPAAAQENGLLEKRESLYNNIFIFGDRDSVTMTFGQNKRYYTESSMKLSDPGALTAMLAAENAKYGTAYGQDMVDPASNSVFALLPEWVFALDSSNFTGSPTRFTFAPAPA